MSRRNGSRSSRTAWAGSSVVRPSCCPEPSASSESSSSAAPTTARSQRSRRYGARTPWSASLPGWRVRHPPSFFRERFSTPSRASTRCCRRRAAAMAPTCSTPHPGRAPDRDPTWLCWSMHAPCKARSPIQTRDSRRLLESGRKRLRPSAGVPTISSIRSLDTAMAPCPR